MSCHMAYYHISSEITHQTAGWPNMNSFDSLMVMNIRFLELDDQNRAQVIIGWSKLDFFLVLLQ